MNGSSSEAQDLMEWFCWSPKTRRVPQEAVFAHRMRIPYRRRLFLVPSAFEGAGEGPAGDKVRVNGTQEMAEGAGANKESGVLSEANCCRSDWIFWAVFIKKVGNPAAVTRDVKKSSWCALANEMRK